MNLELQNTNSNIQKQMFNNTDVGPNLFDKISDADLIELVKRIHALELDSSIQNFKAIVGLAYKSTGLKNILHKSVRVINGAKYELCIAPKNNEESNILIKWLIEKLDAEYFKTLCADLESRIEALPEKNLDLDRLKAELEEIEEKKKDNYFLAGYKSNRTGKDVTNYCIFNSETKQADYLSCVQGSVYFRFEKFVQKKIEYANELSGFDTHKETQIPMLLGPTHTLAEIGKLGILKFLFDTHRSKFKTEHDFAKFICSLFKLPDESNIGTIVREYPAFISTHKSNANAAHSDNALSAVRNHWRKLKFDESAIRNMLPEKI